MLSGRLTNPMASSRQALVIVLLLGCLGCEGGSPSRPSGTVPEGAWGGDHVTLDVGPSSAFIEFDCAHGTLQGPLTLTGGQFDVGGLFVLERGGPIREDDPVLQQPARYSGNVNDRTMTLRVRIIDTMQDLGTYSLRFGTRGRLVKCL